MVVTVATPHGPVRVMDTGGEGRPLLLVHSLLVDGAIWAPLVRLLSVSRRCLVPELPFGAHGLPLDAAADLAPLGLADLVVEVLDAVGVASVDVIGADSGGALTQLLMAHHRDRIERVVLCPCDAYEAFPPPSLRPLLATLNWRAGVWLTAQSSRSKLVRRPATLRRFTHAGIDAATVAGWAARLRSSAGVRRDLRKVVRGTHRRYTLAAAHANRDFPRPVLVVWGSDDRVFPRRLAERLVHDLPDARLAVLADCSLFVPLDHPHLLASLVNVHLGPPVQACRTLGGDDAAA